MLIAQRYRLGASLGRGGMGEVYRARDEVLGRDVAVKLMLRSDDNASATERFQREARAAARLSDPHIVAVYDFGQYDDNFYLVMELVEGRSVAAELAADGPLSWERAISVVEQAAAGLAAAHAQNVVHRDIKPSNLLIAADGTVKVADFGIAHLPGTETNELTMTGQIMGSPHYLSPERAQGRSGGPESDVYALGCVLYQLVTGRPPFLGDHPTAVLYQHVDKDPELPSQLRPELAGPFEGLVLRMLAKAPEARPTAAQLAAASTAGEWMHTPALPSKPVPAPAVVPAGGVVPAAPAAGEPQEPAPGPGRSRKPLIIGALAALVLGGAVAAGVVLNNLGDNLPTTGDVGPEPSKSVGVPNTSTSPTDDPTRDSEAGGGKRTTPADPTTAATTPGTTPTATPTTPAATPTATPSSPSATPTPRSTPTKTPSTSPTPTPTPTKTSESPTPTPTTTTSDTPPPSDPPTP